MRSAFSPANNHDGTFASHSSTSRALASPAPEIDLIDLISSEDEQQPAEPAPPCKRRRHSTEISRSPARASPAVSASSSQATVPQPTAFGDAGLNRAASPCQEQPKESASEPALSVPAVKQCHAMQLDIDKFVGLSTKQISQLQPGDHLWWLSDHDDLQLACCSPAAHCQSSIPIFIVWDPSAKLNCPGHNRWMTSAPERLQRHFFPGQAIEWQQDGIANGDGDKEIPKVLFPQIHLRYACGSVIQILVGPLPIFVAKLWPFCFMEIKQVPCCSLLRDDCDQV